MKKRVTVFILLLLLMAVGINLFKVLYSSLNKPQLRQVAAIKKNVPAIKKNVPAVEKVMKVDIVSVKASGLKFKVGKKISININLKNSGDNERKFFVSGSVNSSGGSSEALPLKTITIKSGGLAVVSYDYGIPESGKTGKYEFSAVAGTEVNRDGTVGGAKSKGAWIFDVTGLSIEGRLVSLNVEKGKKYFGDKIIIKAVFENTGEAAHEFHGKITVSNPEGKETIVFEKKVNILEGGKNEAAVEYKVDNSMTDGLYEVKASMTKSTGEPCGTATGNFTVIDKPPVFVLYVGVPATNVGDISEITALVRDDKELKEVKLSYQGPGMNKPELVDMTKLSGNEREAFYHIRLESFNMPGIIKYHVELKDSKGQDSNSRESTQEIKMGRTN